MSKAQKSEVIEFPSFDATEVTDQFRAYAEKGVEQSKEFYAKAKEAAEGAQKAIEETFESSKVHGTALSLKAINAARANATAGFSHMESLVKAKTFAEVIELQSAFARTQMEALADQAKEIQTLATKAFEDASKPVKAIMEKAIKSAKAA
jgi:phasin